MTTVTSLLRQRLLDLRVPSATLRKAASTGAAGGPRGVVRVLPAAA